MRAKALSRWHQVVGRGTVGRFGRTAAVIAAVFVPAFAGVAYAAPSAAAAATVTPFSFTFTETFDTPLPECFDPNLVGTTTNTNVVTGQAVETSSGVFTVHFTVDVAFHLDFPNGMFASGDGEVDHNHFVTNGSVVVSSFVSRDPHTVFNADGSIAAQIVIHAGTQLTYHDLNGDGVPQADEISASVDRFFFTCH